MQLDSRLEETTFRLVDWPLSRVLLKNHADYPWLILVPRREGVVEMTELTTAESVQFIKEVSGASRVLQAYFKPDKLNLGALGNVVPQLHFHVVGRFTSDPLWPQGIWQASMTDKKYDDPHLVIEALIDQLTAYEKAHVTEWLNDF